MRTEHVGLGMFTLSFPGTAGRGGVSPHRKHHATPMSSVRSMLDDGHLRHISPSRGNPIWADSKARRLSSDA